MEKPSLPSNEHQRLQALYGLNILDTEAEERFDRITRIAQKLFQVPIALISLVDKDRQWFKSKYGISAPETSREISFCGHAILRDEILVVENALDDKRFKDNPLVVGAPDIRLYVGCPLKINDQYNVGTLCLIDNKARKIQPEDLKIIRDLADMVEAELKSFQISNTDELTGISNRRGFIILGEKVVKLSARYQKEVHVLFFDLDKFKAVNDTYGHSEGDKVLKEFSQRLLETFRDSDIVARIGGDEFCVLCSGTTDEHISSMIERLQLALAKTQKKAYQIGCSIGAVRFDPKKHRTLSELIEDADKKMYVDKKTKL